jgi:hypothetical protein
MKLLLLALIPSVLLGVGTTACDQVDRLFDCTQVCERWRDCADSRYDVDGCVERCEDNAADEPSFDEHADRCENCLDDRTCGESVACAVDCVGIVP